MKQNTIDHNQSLSGHLGLMLCIVDNFFFSHP
jgi:hypothetical protein